MSEAHQLAPSSVPTSGPRSSTDNGTVSDALRTLQVAERATPDTILTAYARLDREFESKLQLALPAFVRSRLMEQRASIVRAKDLLLESAQSRPAVPSTSGALLPSREPDSGRASNAGEVKHQLIGIVLSKRYEVIDFIGEGGMGRVFRAFDKLKQNFVAVKVISPDVIKQKGAQERFVTEAKLACSLSHPNIIRVHDVSVDDDCYYITMELLHGQTLRAKMDEQKRSRVPFPVDQALAMARDLLSALAFAHQHIVHRDIKPENIWVCDDGTVKIMDFGVALSLQSGQKSRTMQSVGSAYYVAPEQLRGLALDRRADQYSIATVLYELFTGRVPTGVIKPLHQVRKEVPQTASNAIMRALHPAPEERYATTDEFLTRLTKADSRDVLTQWNWQKAALAGVVLLFVGVATAVVLQQDLPKKLHLFQGASDRDSAIKAQVVIGQLLTQLDTTTNDRKTKLNALQEKIARLRDAQLGGKSPEDAAALQRQLDDAHQQLAQAQSENDLWITQIYPAASRSDLESKRALADMYIKEAKHAQALELYVEIQAYAEPRALAMSELENLAKAKGGAMASASRWDQLASDKQQGMSKQWQVAEEGIALANVALAAGKLKEAASAYRDSEKIYDSLLSAAQEQVTSAARAQAEAQHAVVTAAIHAKAKMKAIEDAKRAEQLRVGRQFRDALRSGGQGPLMVVTVSQSGSNRLSDDDNPSAITRKKVFARSVASIDAAQLQGFFSETGYRPRIHSLRQAYRDSEGLGEDVVTIEDAIAYVSWLSDVSGVKYQVGATSRVADSGILFWVNRAL